MAAAADALLQLLGERSTQAALLTYSQPTIYSGQQPTQANNGSMQQLARAAESRGQRAARHQIIHTRTENPDRQDKGGAE